jgi:predicted phage terminase large subunit-like protein
VTPRSASEDSDETGIIVAGLGEDGHAYVFDDVTCTESPDGWGRRAVRAYHVNGADVLVAEVNNGGDMVGHVIRTIDPNVNFKAVRATKGKVRRAEPVAALYEQGRVHHVGVFGALEAQMRMMTPAADLIDSPDRADALVWVLTELMVNVQRPVLYPEYRESLHVIDIQPPAPMTRYMAILPTEAGSHAILWVGVDKWSDVYVYRELSIEGDYTLAEYAEAIAAMEGAIFDIRHAGTTSEGAIIRPGGERTDV